MSSLKKSKTWWKVNVTFVIKFSIRLSSSNLKCQQHCFDLDLRYQMPDINWSEQRSWVARARVGDEEKGTRNAEQSHEKYARCDL